MLLWIIISYDIACQWSKNFFNRLKAMPPRLQFKQALSLQFKVPKFHLPAHKADCHSRFSFNYTPGVGRTDGEGVERNWSWLNGAAASTSQMGPGSRSDTLDDFMGFSNYRKVTNFGELGVLLFYSYLLTFSIGNSLFRRLVLAIPDAIIHNEAFATLHESLQQKHAPEVAEWEQMVKDWEHDSSKSDPYQIPEECKVSLSSVHTSCSRPMIYYLRCRSPRNPSQPS
jgi:hypothetical protein